MIPQFFRIAAGRFLVLLLAYFASRLFFLYWNLPTFAQVPRGDIVWSFIYGLRFDLAAIFITNIPVLLLWILPGNLQRHRWFRALEFSLFMLLNMVALGMNFADAEFVKFIGKRSSYDLLMISGDVQRHSLSILWTYRHFLVGLTVLAVVLFFSVPRFKAENPNRNESWLGWLGWRIVLVAIAAIGIRGGFQFKPLHPMHAYFTTKHQIGLLTLNTPFNFIKSKPRMGIERIRYFQDDAEAIRIANEATALSRPPLGVAKNWNVVFILLESFASEYTGAANNGQGYTPFFDELAKQAYYFKYNFANSHRSIEGLPAALCGLPGIMLEPIITSDFSNNRFDCLPKILSEKGYRTYFLHGAHNGSMHFDTFSKIAGFEKFVGLNEYPKNNPEDLDPYWGVLDEPMLQYAIKTLDESPKPAFVGVFTLSSHHPYYIPEKYKNKFPKGTLEIHESIGYTDHSLRQFFEVARTKDWYNNTVFVLTADHTQKSDRPEYADLLGGARVPLLIFVPGLKQPVPFSPERVTQHADIVPSVLDLLGVNKEDRLLTGHSVFDQKNDGFVYNYTSASYWYLDRRIFVDMGRPPQPTEANRHRLTFDLQKISDNEPDVQAGMLKLKAIVHYLNTGLINNSLHDWKKASEQRVK